MVAVCGNLSLDVVAGSRPRIGGGPYYAARALRALGARACVVGRCARDDRARLLPELARLGLPVVLLDGASTASFAIAYDGERRRMDVRSLGDAWMPADAKAIGTATWVHVAPLVRSDFPVETIAALAVGRRIALDGQGLVRPSAIGELVLDADFDPAVLEHVAVLKLAEEEALALLGTTDERALRRLRVPEIVLTFGSRGSIVVTPSRSDRIAAHPLPADPTGAGDAFTAAYVVARSGGASPVTAARRATALVASVLAFPSAPARKNRG